MSFELQTSEAVIDGVRRVAAEQIDEALASLSEADDPHETVHYVRKRCKKVRALCRLVRGAFPEYGDTNEHLRDTARLLSDLRDATANLGAIDRLVRRRGDALDDDAVAKLREALESRRRRLVEQQDLAERFEQVRRRLQELRATVGDWSLDVEGFDAVAPGLRKTYKRARNRAFEAGEERGDDALFHEWRKRVKYHRYHVDLLAPIWPKMLEAREDLCHRLTDGLGDDHDLVVLRERLSELDLGGEAADLAAVFDGLGRRWSEELREHSLHLGRWLFVDDPDAFVARVEQWWNAART